MFAVVVFFEIKSAHVAEFEEAIKTNAKASVENELGCKQFDVCRDPQDPNTFFLYEIYDDRNAFDAHKASAHYLAFSSVTESWVTNKKVLTYDVVAANSDR